MTETALHPEVIRMRLRMTHGTIKKFEIARGLPARSVSDVLRGRSVRQTEKAIAEELGIELHEVSTRYADFASTNADDNSADTDSHRLNEVAR